MWYAKLLNWWPNCSSNDDEYCNIIRWVCILQFLIIYWERVDGRITIVLHMSFLGNFRRRFRNSRMFQMWLSFKSSTINWRSHMSYRWFSFSYSDRTISLNAFFGEATVWANDTISFHTSTFKLASSFFISLLKLANFPLISLTFWVSTNILLDTSFVF